jgi:hypothetical protein
VRGKVSAEMAEAFRLRDDVSLVATDDGAVLLDQRAGRYWQLNGTGYATLRALLDGRTPEESARHLVDTHEVSMERATADVVALVRLLSEAKLVMR